LDGTAHEWNQHSVHIPTNGMVEIARAAFPSPDKRNRREWVYAASLVTDGSLEDQAVWTLAPHRELALPQPEISVVVQNEVLEVKSSVYCHGVHLEDEGREILEDNYFDLLPNIPRRVRIITPTPSGIYPLTAIMPIVS